MSTITITAAEVNKLRQQTGAGMMDCRKALIESDGDFEKAVDYLRKKGQKVAALRSGKEAKEGVVIAQTSADHKTGVIVNLSCETDFVAKNADFIAFAKSIAGLALSAGVKTTEELNAASLGGVKVQDKIMEQVARIGEKIHINKFEKLTGEGVIPYIHAGYRIGVLVALNRPLNDAIETAARNIAMQIAAMNPVAIDTDSVPADVVAREREIAIEQVKAEGKPAAIAEKIAEGKVNKFFKEHTLLQQAFVKESDKTVAEYLKSVDADLKVTAFTRVALG